MLGSSHGGSEVIIIRLTAACEIAIAGRFGARSYTHDHISPPANVKVMSDRFGAWANEKMTAFTRIAGSVRLFSSSGALPSPWSRNLTRR